MRESLIKLLELQEIDREIDALRQSQTDFPTEIDRLQRELKAARDQLDLKQQQAEDLEKNRRILERDLEVIAEDLKKHQDRLYEVKTNKEYDALQHEIEALQNRKGEQETTIIETIETVEDLKGKLAEDETHYQEGEKERQERIQDLSEKLDSVESNVKGWEKKRSAIEPQIERRPLSVYNRIRKAMRGGVAVVLVRKASCGGCYRQLSPQRLVEVRRGDTVLRCENCGRILVWKEEAEVAV